MGLKPRGGVFQDRRILDINILQNSINNYFSNIQSDIISSITDNTNNNISHSLKSYAVDNISTEVDNNSIRVISGKNRLDQPVVEMLANNIDCQAGGKRRNREETNENNRSTKRHCLDTNSKYNESSTCAPNNDDIPVEQTIRQPCPLDSLSGPHTLVAEKGEGEGGDNAVEPPPRETNMQGDTGPYSNSIVYASLSQSQTERDNVSPKSITIRDNLPPAWYLRRTVHFLSKDLEWHVILITNRLQARGKTGGNLRENAHQSRLSYLKNERCKATMCRRMYKDFMDNTRLSKRNEDVYMPRSRASVNHQGRIHERIVILFHLGLYLHGSVRVRL